MKHPSNKLIFTLLLCAGLSAGCATTNQPAETYAYRPPTLSDFGAFFRQGGAMDEKFLQLHNGMSRQEVIQILGNPDRVDDAEDARGPTETLVYLGRFTSGWSWARADYEVDLREGKVISYSRNLDVNTSYQASIGTVAIVSTNQTPILNFEGLAKGKGKGALAGAGGTFVSCLSGLGGGSCSGSFCGPAYLLWIGICGTAGLVGGVAGGAQALSESEVMHYEDVLNQAAQVRVIQSALRDEIESNAESHGISITPIPSDLASSVSGSRDYQSLAPLGIDTVVETTLTKAGTTGAGINAPIYAFMQVHVRLVKADGNQQIYARDYTYAGKKLKFEQWAADDGRPLQEEFEKGYHVLGKEIYLDVFELYPFPDRVVHSAGGLLSTAFGLAPISPPTRGQLTDTTFISDVFDWYKVDSVYPTLKWQAFPRPSDVAVSPEEMKRVRNVTYDLVIAEERDYAPADIVYRESGLSEPEHKLTTPLKLSQRYFWTVRAHFELDGRQRVTEWGATSLPPRWQTAPSSSSFRFRTPR